MGIAILRVLRTRPGQDQNTIAMPLLVQELSSSQAKSKPNQSNSQFVRIVNEGIRQKLLKGVRISKSKSTIKDIRICSFLPGFSLYSLPRPASLGCLSFPVHFSILHAADGAETKRQEKQDRPSHRDDKPDGEDSKSRAWQDKRCRGGDGSSRHGRCDEACLEFAAELAHHEPCAVISGDVPANDALRRIHGVELDVRPHQRHDLRVVEFGKVQVGLEVADEGILLDLSHVALSSLQRSSRPPQVGDWLEGCTRRINEADLDIVGC